MAPRLALTGCDRLGTPGSLVSPSARIALPERLRSPRRLRKHVHYEPNHDTLVFWIGLRDQERKRRQPHIVDDRSIGTCEPPIAMQKFDEQQRADPLISVRKGMIFDDKVE